MPIPVREDIESEHLVYSSATQPTQLPIPTASPTVQPPSPPTDYKLPSDAQLRHDPDYLEFRKLLIPKAALRKTKEKKVADEIRKTNPHYETEKEKKWRIHVESLAEHARQREIKIHQAEQAAKRRRFGRTDMSFDGNYVGPAASQRTPRKAALAPQQSIRDEMENMAEPLLVEDSPSSLLRPLGSSESPEPVEFRPPRSPQGAHPSNDSRAQASILVEADHPTQVVSMTTTALQLAPHYDQPENNAGPSTVSPRLYETHYPAGGDSYDNDGYGIFVDPETEEGLEIWIDTRLPDRISMINAIQEEGGRIATDHTKDSSQLIILSPASTYIFDMYCHPDWLSRRRQAIYRKRKAKKPRVGVEAELALEQQSEEEEQWQKKVLLKGGWIEKCVERGQFLGAADRWGGFRAGGPPPDVRTTSDPQTGTGQSEVAADTTPQVNGEAQVVMEIAPQVTFTVDGQLSPKHADKGGGAMAMDLDEQGDSRPVYVHATMPGDEMSIAHGFSGDAEPVRINNAVPLRPTEFHQELLPKVPIDIDVRTVQRSDIHQTMVFNNVQASEQPEVSTIDPQYVSPTGSVENVSKTSVTSLAHAAEDEAALDNAEQDERSAYPSQTPGKEIEQAENAIPQPRHVAEEAESLHPAAAEELVQAVEPVEETASTPPDPATIFSGCTFWVDMSYPDRAALIRKLKAAGGKLCSEYSQATHVLIHNYKHAQWADIVNGIVREGVWFMHMLWALRSLEVGRKLAEAEFAVPSGNPLRAASVEEEKPLLSQRSHDTGGHIEPYMSSERLAEIFEKEGELLQNGLSLRALADLLVDKYGTYTARNWQNLMLSFRRKQDRFAYLTTESSGSFSNIKSASTASPERSSAPAIGIPNSSTVPANTHATPPSNDNSVPGEVMRPIFLEISKAVKEGMKRKAVLREMVAKYGRYSYPTLKVLYKQYRRKIGPFALSVNEREAFPEPELPITPLGHNVAQSTEKSNSSTGTTSSVDGTATSTQSSTPRNKAYMTPADIAQAFMNEVVLAHRQHLSTTEIASMMLKKYPGYTKGTWGILYLDWRSGRRQFAGFGPSYGAGNPISSMGSSQPARKLSADGAKVPTSHGSSQVKNAYTDGEDRAMAAYIVGRPKSGRSGANFWKQFHRQYPGRTISGYSQHYSSARAKIEAYATKIEARATEGKSVEPLSGDTQGKQAEVEQESHIPGGSQQDPLYVASDDDNEVTVLDTHSRPPSQPRDPKRQKGNEEELLALASTSNNKGLTAQEQEDLEIGLALRDTEEDVLYVPSSSDEKENGDAESSEYMSVDSESP